MKTNVLRSLPLLIINFISNANAACNIQSCAITSGVAFAADVTTLALAPETAGIFCASAVGVGIITPLAIIPDILCLASVLIPVAIAGASAGCTSCTHATGCDQNDHVARANACGLSGPGSVASDAVLGPNKCLQLKTSVLHPDPHTDRFVGGPGLGYEFHCANNGLVIDQTDTTCYWKCEWCTPQCDGINITKRAEVGGERMAELEFAA